MGFLGGANSKEPTCDAGDQGASPGLGRSPGKGHGNPLQYSCLENHMVRGAWLATVHRITKSWTGLKQLGMHAHRALKERARPVKSEFKKK